MIFGKSWQVFWNTHFVQSLLLETVTVHCKQCDRRISIDRLIESLLVLIFFSTLHGIVLLCVKNTEPDTT